MTAKLETAAIRAHRRGACWAEYWAAYGHQVRAAEPYHAGRYHRLVRRLMALVASGNTDGMAPVCNIDMPWDDDDLPEPEPPSPHDTATRARCQLPLLAISGVTTADRIGWQAAGVAIPTTTH
jgi:hypothetical protein